MALQPVWQCPKCFHTSKDKKMIETCDKSHKSILEKNNKVIEFYGDRAKIPHTLEIEYHDTTIIYTYRLVSTRTH